MATGFVFRQPEPRAFLAAVREAVALWSDREAWQALQRSGMQQDFSWQRSARRYLDLYLSLTRQQPSETTE
jgi:starch synthase